MSNKGLKVAPIIDMKSSWVDNSLMRATVKQYNDRYVVTVMEITEKRTAKSRCRKFATYVARSQRANMSADYVQLADAEIDQKGQRLDGTKVLTRVRTMVFAFGTIE